MNLTHQTSLQLQLYTYVHTLDANIHAYAYVLYAQTPPFHMHSKRIDSHTHTRAHEAGSTIYHLAIMRNACSATPPPRPISITIKHTGITQPKSAAAAAAAAEAAASDAGASAPADRAAAAGTDPVEGNAPD